MCSYQYLVVQAAGFCHGTNRIIVIFVDLVNVMKVKFLHGGHT